MPKHQPISIFPPPDCPRHAQQEIADLLAAALLRMRRQPERNAFVNSERVRLGFPGHQRVNANPDQNNGVRP